MAKKTIESTSVSTRITKHMHGAILELLEVNDHLNVADYLRDLIRKDLEKRGVSFESKSRENTQGHKEGVEGDE